MMKINVAVKCRTDDRVTHAVRFRNVGELEWTSYIAFGYSGNTLENLATTPKKR